MKIEDQVCTVKQAKILTELGIKAESYLWWRNDHSDNPGRYENKWYIENEYPYTFKPEKAIKHGVEWRLLPAYSVAELGQMMPAIILYKNAVLTWESHKITGSYVGYVCSIMSPKDVTVESFKSKTEADARAKAFIYLIQNKLININEKRR